LHGPHWAAQGGPDPWTPPASYAAAPPDPLAGLKGRRNGSGVGKKRGGRTGERKRGRGIRKGEDPNF